MIVEFFGSRIYETVLYALKFIGFPLDFTFEFPALDTFLDVLSAALYFFPWRYIYPIPVIICSLMMFRIAVTSVRFVLSIVGKLL